MLNKNKNPIKTPIGMLFPNGLTNQKKLIEKNVTLAVKEISAEIEILKNMGVCIDKLKLFQMIKTNLKKERKQKTMKKAKQSLPLASYSPALFLAPKEWNAVRRRRRLRPVCLPVRWFVRRRLCLARAARPSVLYLKI